MVGSGRRLAPLQGGRRRSIRSRRRPPRPRAAHSNRKDERDVEEQAGCSVRRRAPPGERRCSRVGHCERQARTYPRLRQAGLHHEVPGGLLLHAGRRGESLAEGASEREHHVPQGKSATDDAGEIAAIQDMVASGVKGIAITPTSQAVISALDKAVKSGVKVVLDGQRSSDLEVEELGRRHEQPGRRHACRQVAREEAEARRHDRDPRRGPRRARPRRPGERHAGGSRRHEEQDQDRLQARDGLRPDQGCGGSADNADGELEPDGDLLRLRSARAGRDPVDQERRHQAGRDHPCRLRRARPRR